MSIQMIWIRRIVLRIRAILLLTLSKQFSVPWWNLQDSPIKEVLIMIDLAILLS